VLVAAIAIGGYLYEYAPQDLYTAAPYPTATSTTPSAPAKAPVTVSSSSLVSGTSAAGEASRKNFVVRDATGLAKLSELLYGSASSTMPAVDFTKHDVIAVFAGSEPSGGYAISISKIVDTADARVVYVTITSPGKGCMTTQALTSPYAVVTAPKSGLPLKHVDATETKGCN
jgi:hypothetical protein